MRGFWMFGLAGMIGMAAVDPSGAVAADEPYLAVRTGFRCAVCHTNRTGGGKRNDFGVVFAQTRLPMKVTGLGKEGSFVATRITDLLSLGADLRVNTSREFTGTNPKNPLISEGNIYVEARVIPDRLTIYADQIVAPGSPRTREIFVLLSGLPAESYLKVGKFFLPYGLRLLDDGEFIRQTTGFNYTNSDQGIELGVEPGTLSLAVALTNGTQGAAENNSSKQVSGLASLVFSRFRVGASASRNDAPAGRQDVVGAFGGFRLGRFAFLGEFDYIFVDPPEQLPAGFPDDPDLGDQFAAFVEGDLLLARGLNVKVTYGFLDPDRGIGENARTRLRFGVEPFITQFLQVSIFYTLLEDIPQATADRDKLTVELHGFF